MVDQQRKLVYPPAGTVDQIDEYHGVTVADPYRWLEDVQAEETKAWVDAQQRLTASYLAAIPARAQLKQRLTTLWNYERYDVFFKRGGRYFFLKNDGLQHQSVLYTMMAWDGEPMLPRAEVLRDGTIRSKETLGEA
jgi:prolyl oligopeptidase